MTTRLRVLSLSVVVTFSTVAFRMAPAPFISVLHAFGDPPLAPPTVTTGAVTFVGALTAELTLTVNPNGLATTATIQFGPTTAYGSAGLVAEVAAGTSPVEVGFGVSGLACSTLYHYRATATSVLGTTNGLDATFTTLPCYPTVATGIASRFSATGATLNGTATPNLNATTAWFEYGLTTSYGSTTPVQSLGAGLARVAIDGGGVTGLTCNAVYHFRATATNASGTSSGSDATFSPPCAEADPKIYGVVSDDSRRWGVSAAWVFNASTLAPPAFIPLPGTTSYSVAVTQDQSLAFVARSNGIYVIDLTLSPPVLAAGINPIPRPASFVEDMSLTPDGRFLVVSSDFGATPITVINTATRTVVGTFSFLTDHNSIEVCDNGAVLVTSYASQVVKRLSLSAAGMLTDTGQSLALGTGPMNVTCARGGHAGVVVNSATGDLRSFLVNGMTLVSTQVLPGNPTLGGFNGGLNVAINGSGTRVFGCRSRDFLTAYDFNSITGVIGAQLWSTNVGVRGAYSGVNQIAVQPNGRRVFASTNGFVLSLNGSNGAVNGSVGMYEPSGIAIGGQVRGASDFDGDGKSDVTVFRPSTGGWYDLHSTTDYTSSSAHIWGASTDTVVPGDYDGDGKLDPAVFRPSTAGWYFLRSSTNYTTSGAVTWGASTDMPVPGDYDGDGKTDPAFFQPSTGGWYFMKSSSNYATSGAVTWGASTDITVPGDYDGDGMADPAVFRPSTGGWYFLNSSTNFTTSGAVVWGASTDIPVPADYDGDGRIDPAIFRPSTGLWAMLKSSSHFTSSLAAKWGIGTDTPINRR